MKLAKIDEFTTQALSTALWLITSDSRERERERERVSEREEWE